MVDCNEVMQLLLKTQSDNSEMADDDPQVNTFILYTTNYSYIYNSVTIMNEIKLQI